MFPQARPIIAVSYLPNFDLARSSRTWYGACCASSRCGGWGPRAPRRSGGTPGLQSLTGGVSASAACERPTFPRCARWCGVGVCANLPEFLSGRGRGRLWTHPSVCAPFKSSFCHTLGLTASCPSTILQLRDPEDLSHFPEDQHVPAQLLGTSASVPSGAFADF